MTTESTASPRGNSQFQTNRLKLKITIFISFLMLPSFWKTITFDERNPMLRLLVPLWKRKNQIIKTLHIIKALQFPKDHLLLLLLLLLLGGSQASLVCRLVKTMISMNTGRKMKTRETKYSEKNLALEQNNAQHSSSQLQLTEGQKGETSGPSNKKGCDLRNFRKWKHFHCSN